MEHDDGHSTKRLKNDSGYGVGMGSRDAADGAHKVPPSPVVHVRGLAENVTDSDLHEAVLNFGIVSYVIRIPNKTMALIEFENVDSATNLVAYAQTNPVCVAGRPAQFNYSTSTRIKRPESHPPAPPNHVILLTIVNARFPITVDVVNAICCTYGNVLRIVIFRKTGVQAMVEYDSVDAAARAKDGLQGQDIYSGCCTIKSEFAKPESLNVRRNDSDTWDFTLNSFPKEAQYFTGQKNQPLLADPRFGPMPMPFGNDSPRRGGQMKGSGQVPLLQHQQYGGGYPGSSGGYNGGYSSNYSDPYQNESQSHHSPLTPMALLNAYESFACANTLGTNNNCVLMVYDMDAYKFNCQRLFNLLCIYGNVLKIKFLKSKEGSAMVQMGDRESCDRVIHNLNGISCFGSKLSIGISKQPYLQDVLSPHQLPDGSSAYMDFIGSRNQRYTSPDSASKNRPVAPTTSLYFFNAPPNIEEDVLRQVFESVGVNPPEKILKFQPKSEKSSRGLLQWCRVESCTEALVCANHAPVQNPAGGKVPFVLKLSFSHSIVE